MLIREALAITVTDTRLGAAVRFAKDQALIDSLKARFPRARWGAGTKSWHIPGKMAVARAQLWAADQGQYLAALEAAARDAEWDAPPPPRKAQLVREDVAAVGARLDALHDSVVLWGFVRPVFGWRQTADDTFDTLHMAAPKHVDPLSRQRYDEVVCRWAWHPKSEFLAPDKGWCPDYLWVPVWPSGADRIRYRTKIFATINPAFCAANKGQR